MSGTEAFLSFYDQLKADLASIVPVFLDGEKTPASGNYAVLEDGPEQNFTRWSVRRFCQLRLMVFGAGTNAMRDMARITEQIKAVVNLYGTLTRYKYPQGQNKVAVGVYLVRVSEVTANIALDEGHEQRIITFIIETNARVS